MNEKCLEKNGVIEAGKGNSPSSLRRLTLKDINVLEE